ncbi:MAG: hypothetical protein OXG24_01655 [Gammaproteobacteria bacterium]|nr:hypothetical protein [Gammaproteobacteria bacterium]
MKNQGTRRIGLIIICAVLTPFSLDVVWNLLPLASFKTAGFLYSLLCFVFFVLIVWLFSVACTRLTKAIDAHHALLFTLASLIAMRIQHLVVDQPHAIELNQALALTFACLLVFSVYLLRSRKSILGERKQTEDK